MVSIKIRQSGIQTWARCPESFRLQYVVGNRGRQSAAASFGTVTHFALQTYHLNDRDLDLAKRTFEHYWEHPEQMSCAPEYYLPRTSWTQYRSTGMAMLEWWHEEQRWTSDEIIGLELPFTLPIGEHELTGTMDLLRITTNIKGKRSLDVADFKTGKVPTFLRYNVQFTAYTWATLQDAFWDQVPDGDMWRLKVDGLPRTATWLDLKNQKVIDAGERVAGDYVRLEKTVNAMATSVSQNIYVPTLTGDACAYCDFVKECGLPAGNLNTQREAEQGMAEAPIKLLEW